MSVSALPDTRVLRVADLDVARRFHVHTIGGMPVRGTADRLEIELFGHPLTLVVGDVGVPSRVSFVLGVDDWCTVSERLRAHDVDVDIEPGRRFSAVPGEQCAMRLEDPDGHVVELRGFAAEANLLAA